MLIDQDSSTLVLVDLQQRLMPSIHQSASVINQCVRISEIAKILEIPIIGTQQSPKSIGTYIEEVSRYCEKTIQKEHFNACFDGLIGSLPLNRPEVILAGCETHICVMQTALGLIDADYSVTIIVDAVGSRNAFDGDVALKRLERSGAILSTVEMISYEWLRSAKNESFKEVLELIKVR